LEAPVERIECSVWNNGSRGWGLKVLGGPDLRRDNFNRNLGCVAIDLDGVEVWVNISKKSFWSESCGELLIKQIGAYVERHHLQPSDRIWLKVIEPGARFAAELDTL
jgi:hypothetical protein